MGASQKLQPQGLFSTNDSAVALDVAYLNRATFGDLPLRSEIISLFLSQINGLVRRLDLPMDHQSWLFLTHTLKGAAAAVGAKHMGEIARDWEQRPAPVSSDARLALSAELNGAVLAFEKAASKLH